MKRVLALVFLLIFSFPALANKTHIELTGSTSKKATNTEQNSAKTSQLSGKLMTPVSFKIKEGGIQGYFLNGKGAITTLDPLPDLNRKVTTTQASLGGSYLLVDREKELLALNIAGQTSNSGSTSALIQPLVSALASKNINEHFSFIYGGAYTYTFGDGHLLPLLGFNWAISKQSKLLFILPMSLRYIVNTSEENSLELFIKPEGLRSKIANNNSFAGRNENLYYRLREFKIGAKYNWEFKTENIFFAEAGIHAKRQVSIFSGKDKIYEKDLHASPYIALGLRFGLGDNNLSLKDIDFREI